MLTASSTETCLAPHRASDGRAPARIAAGLACLLLCVAAPAEAAEPAKGLNVKWGEDYQSINFDFRGARYEYPKQFVEQTFPSIGQAPQMDVKAEWPIVTLRARWSMSGQGWPEEYRGEALELMLMYACDAALYSRTYPKTILESRFTSPPEFRKAVDDPAYDLATVLRGAKAVYEIKASAGFGAADYRIRTEIRVGTSAEPKTVFYHDKPSYISDHLENREVICTGWDSGSQIHFEVVIICVNKPRLLFRDEAMRRVRNDSKYFIDTMYEHLNKPPTKKKVEDYYGEVRMPERQLPARKVEPVPSDSEQG
jgi:hypothetical protein